MIIAARRGAPRGFNFTRFIGKAVNGLPAGAYIKQNAKGCLRRHWGPAIGVFFIFAIIYLLRAVSEEVLRLAAGVPLSYNFNISGFVGGLPDTLRFIKPVSLAVTAAFIVFGLLILSPLSLGVKRYFWHLTGDRPLGVACVFDFYSSASLYLRSVALTVRVALQTLAAGAVLMFPAAVLIAFSFILRDGGLGLAQNRNLSDILFSFAGPAAFFGLLVLLFYYQRFFLAGYFAAADDDLEIADAVEYSAAWMHGHKFRLIGFLLSFFPWLLLCLFVLPVLYVYPYLNASLAGFARETVLDHHKRSELFKKPPAAAEKAEGAEDAALSAETAAD